MTTGSHDGTRPRINGHTVTPPPEPGPAPRVTHRKALLAGAGVVTLLVAALALAGRGTDDGGPETGPAGILSTEPAHSTQGAQRAAAAIATSLGSEAMFIPAERHTLVRRAAHPDAEEELQRGFDRDYSPEFNKKIGLDPDGRAPDGARFLSRTMPAGTIVREYSEDQAEVDVWAGGLFGVTGQGRQAPTTSWLTMTIQLRWTSAGWRMTEVSQAKGPAPDAASGAIGQAPPL